jgi:hypothetical protein
MPVRAPESESGTSTSSVTDAWHYEVRSAGLEPARPLLGTRVWAGRVYQNSATSADATTM